MTEMVRIEIPPPNPASTKTTSKSAILGLSSGFEVVVYEVGTIESVVVSGGVAAVVVILHSSKRS